MGKSFLIKAENESMLLLILSNLVFHIVLVAPKIPHNTGAIGRLCLATGAHLHLIEPLGFSLDEKHLKRAGLDYWSQVSCQTWKSLKDCLSSLKINLNSEFKNNCYLFTKKTPQILWEKNFSKGNCFIFGSETKGLPEDILHLHSQSCVKIPMLPESTRSLNLASSVAIALYYGIQQNQQNFT